MCNQCDDEIVQSNGETDKQESAYGAELSSEHSWDRRICHETRELEALCTEASSPSGSRMTSPTTSLSSSDPVDLNSYDRIDHDESPSSKVYIFHQVMEEALVESSFHSNGEIVRNVEILGLKNIKEGKDNSYAGELTEAQHDFQSGTDEVDAELWEPPIADDPEDDLGISVAFNDDDDEEYGDGTQWGKPSYLSVSRDEATFTEGKHKAMQEVENGKFKAFVRRVLKDSGVGSVGKDAESWVDIVTSLSWEAASFLKPNAIDWKRMESDGYVKVKCIANGSPAESHVVKGVVFKKRAAHKHMQATYKNARLMLIRGALGQSSNGLSSFKSIDQEKDKLKSLIDLIDMCHANVILVEKSVSRDVQESILAKGITLVYDMKLHRLEKVSQCTGVPILSSDALMYIKLKNCGSFYFEKFVEEHAAVGEGGKKPRKTLMFIKGCPTCLGCTILLRGSHSDKLKKIKNAVQHAVIIAYRLILEASFLFDRKTMFSSILYAEDVHISPSVHSVSTDDSCILRVDESATETSPSTFDIPISDEFHEENSRNLTVDSEEHSVLSYMPYNPVIFNGFASLSSSLKKAVEHSLPVASATSYQSLTSYFGFNQNNLNLVECVPTPKALELNTEPKEDSDNERILDDTKTEPLMTSSQCLLAGEKHDKHNEDQLQKKDDSGSSLDSESILVLMSSRNDSRRSTCVQSHFSQITFYKNFDNPVAKFLQHNLLNQRSQCDTCGELPEAHVYYYAHRNKQLAIRVKQLPKVLPGETEGKLWMWSRCGKCQHVNGVPRSTRRVLVSTAACCMSFGKFLELGFFHQTSNGTLSSCGHSLERDFLYFFGLGPMAAMLTYSSVTTYAVSLPPRALEFTNSIINNSVKREFENVYAKGISLFTGVIDNLMKLKSKFASSNLKLQGSLSGFSQIEDMLRQECIGFHERIYGVVAEEKAGEFVYKLLCLNKLLWELLLESYIWDLRLHSLLFPNTSVVDVPATATSDFEKFKLKINNTDDEREILIEICDDVSENDEKAKDTVITSASSQEYQEDNMDLTVEPNTSEHSVDGSDEADYTRSESIAFSGGIQGEKIIPIEAEIGIGSGVHNLRKATSLHSLVSTLENSNGWFWMPISEICQIYMSDLCQGIMPKFQPVSSYLQEHIPVAHQLISEEGSRLHIPLGTDNYIVRDYDGELSSIIACALAVLKDSLHSPEVFDEHGDQLTKPTNSLQVLERIPSMVSSHLSSNGSSIDLDPVHSMLSISSDESRFSSFDGLNLLESLVPVENLSPEVSLGLAKPLGKGKYSVTCVYAKQFREFRTWCCQSELDYIASLGRCKNWDAKGGKSKAFFAKTLDDRFIIKELQKTEFESFVEFAPVYFKYMNESFQAQNPTSLAKILGIYQVVIRRAKSGKEIKHLMVMENLTFGRKVFRKYDLKGALHARFNSAADSLESVFLDQNFVNDMNSSPLYISNKAKQLLERAVWNDTTFLNSINVMDYSLFVGVDMDRQELVCGIIDYLRQYTWDKQLETWAKSSLVVPKNTLPTIISPIEYKKRFRKFIGTHFLSVPDSWCSQTSADPCETCNSSNFDDSDESKSAKQERLDELPH